MTELNWASLGLADSLCAALDRAGFVSPSPIQELSLQPQIAGRDILALAQTGSGKTAAFVLPILHGLTKLKGRPQPHAPRALILAPTRELAVQIEETIKRLSGAVKASTLLVFGGVSRAAQIRALRRGVDIVIATPGRLTDLMDDDHIYLGETPVLVLDEADRMLDMGFSKQVQAIARTFPLRRRTALFSATMPEEVVSLAEGLLRDPERVEVARSGETVTTIEQSVELIAHAEKRARLAEILSAPGMERAIVFARTKRGADRVAENLERDGIPAGAIHGNKSQNARQRVLNAFRAGKLRVLVASDIAARGIDVPGISHVVQYEMPDEPEAYVHRIGRTGRNGADGIAIALCSPEEHDKLRAVEKLTKKRLVPEGALPPRRRGKPGGSKGNGPKGGGFKNGGSKSGNPKNRSGKRPPRDAGAQDRPHNDRPHNDGPRKTPRRGPRRRDAA
ncbi:MAG: DEAD/DEAH box helicase [Pseudomonadota bacterium]